MSTCIYERALEHWGEPSQVMMATGECGEFIAEVTKFYLQSKSTKAALVEEAVDVAIMMEQMRLILGKEKVDSALHDAQPFPDDVNDAYKAMLVSKACSTFVTCATDFFVLSAGNEKEILSAVASTLVRVNQMRLIVGESLFDKIKETKLTRLDAIIKGEVSHPHQPSQLS
ncbi:hypothetical protein L1D14_04230 [Vibrio tubiashii]|uniref:hypothetical protein n=1 Tax=Vibrio tubiashii TaxID=29498 RepID=UPI001EFC68BE|nr:hypothetical protein [Vibrio tubiashii]MCG9575439.1 hypothetical protein [Vibrio tubiashii]